jgi:hypothetical protein
MVIGVNEMLIKPRNSSNAVPNPRATHAFVLMGGVERGFPKIYGIFASKEEATAQKEKVVETSGLSEYDFGIDSVYTVSKNPATDEKRYCVIFSSEHIRLKVWAIYHTEAEATAEATKCARDNCKAKVETLEITLPYIA